MARKNPKIALISGLSNPEEVHQKILKHIKIKLLFYLLKNN